MLSSRVFMALMLSGVSLFAFADVSKAQSTEETVVEVPAPSEEAIEQAVQAAEDTAPGAGQQLPEPSLDETARLSPEVIDAWLQEPSSLLDSHPSAGPAMVRYVALLAGSDARSIEALISLAGHPSASRRQARAIAGGLAETAIAAQQTSPDYAAFILLRVAASGNEQLISDFGQLLRGADDTDIDTAELPGTGGAPGGAPGSGVLGGGGDFASSGVGSGSAIVSTSSGSLSIGGGSLSGDVTATDDDVSPVGTGG